jgi:PAS domain S-box-containing protein
MIYQYHVGPDGSAGFPYSSDGIRSLFGVTPEAARTDASRVLAAVHPDDFVQVRDSILRSSATLTPWRREFRVRLPDGQTIWAEGNSTPVVASDGSVSWYGYAADITARKLAEQALKRALEDLQHRNRDLQDFASIASHDLQEPLRKIRMFGDRLAGSIVGLHSEQHDQLTRMVGAAERMSILIDDLLAYSRAGIANDDGGPVDLGELVAEVLVDLEGRTAESDARIEIGPLPRVDGDRVQLRQVLQNLLANALKFRMPGRQPLIRVTGERVAAAAFEPGVAAWARIRVSDNGIGFPPDKAESLFAPFRRLHSRAEYEGTGIGLAIVRRIVERHGGHITAIGRPGGGAEFVVDLPLRE